mgnify:CR=1 FL=1
MPLELRPLQKKDYQQAVQYAIVGMHFERYFANSWLLKRYGHYFFNSELNRATHLLAAYDGDHLVGVLTADLVGQPKIQFSRWRQVKVWLWETLQHVFAGGVDRYAQANQALYAAYRRHYQPDGEINFFAVDPQAQGKGSGTFLLNALKSEVAGKALYLYTDDNCNYRFYEHRGFQRSGTEQIQFRIGKKLTTLQCFLYHREF